MKKTIKIFLLTIFSLILLSLFPKVEANSINSISMDIAIDDNGNASVTEIWECKTSQGTEVYHPYYNLGNSEISNLTVSENGTKYTLFLFDEYSSTPFARDLTTGACIVDVLSFSFIL